MNRFFRMFTGAILLALVINIGIVCAADGEVLQPNLSVSKVVSSTGPYEIGDHVTWIVTLWNNGPGNATNITVAENVTGLTGLQDITAVASLGDYETTTNLWNITEIENATSATLTLTTNFSSSGDKINTVNITAFDWMNLNVTANSAEATVQINAPDIIIPQSPKADLVISKIVSSAGPYDLDDNVTWVVTLRNNGPDKATNITVAEDVTGLTGLQDITAVASTGIYDLPTNVWNISELENDTSATLTLTTNFSSSGSKVNKVNITTLSETDPIVNHNSAEATVQFNTTDIIIPDTPVSANLVIKPTTLNLKSKGVFTVYVSLNGTSWMSQNEGTNKSRIDFANSSLTCGGADMVRATVSEKDSGTLIAKFHRQDLENVTAGDGVRINCSGSFLVKGKTITVEGSDTIRVIGEKIELDKILSRLWKFLGISKEDVEITEGDDGNVTLLISLNPDNFRNPGQIKKTLKNQDNKSATEADNKAELSDENQDVKEHPSKNNGNITQIRETNADNKAELSDENQDVKEHPSKNNGNITQIRETNADNKAEKGNNDKNGRDDESAGKSNGKKNN
jgi:uncharacterized repeat protein (TIGR01451 family)